MDPQLVFVCKDYEVNWSYCIASYSVAALHQGAPGQMTWLELEDPPPWLKPWLRPAQPCVLLCFGNSVNRK